MKLIVNIPAYNEEAKIAETIGRIKKSFEADFYHNEGKGITEKLVQIVDDGSSDSTVKEAERAGADLIVSYKPNRRLAYSFKRAVENSLENDADFMVNIDADGQFDPNDIPKLLAPIVSGECDMVIADRFGGIQAKDIPWVKSFLNRFAASLVGYFLNVKTNDLTCGFRAHSRETLMRLSLSNVNFTYTQETIIDAIGKNLKLKWVPVEVTYFADRQSRIAKSLWAFVNNGFKIILKAIRDVRPMKFFGIPGLFLIFLSLVGFASFLVQYLWSDFKITPYLNYLFFSSVTFIIGVQLLIFAFVADMIKTNRKLAEDMLYFMRKEKYTHRSLR